MSKEQESAITQGEEVNLTPEIDSLTAVVDALARQAGIKPETWQNFKSVIQPLAEHSPITYAHSLRVGIYAHGIALSEDQPDLHFPLFAGCGHDIGKIGIEKGTLETTSGITEEQYEDIKRHAEIGYHTLKETHLYSGLVAGLHHAYKPDGYGIELEDHTSPPLSDGAQQKVEAMAKLIMLVDFFDALTTRKNDKGLAEFGDTDAQKAVLLENFPTSEQRVEWLFSNRIIT